MTRLEFERNKMIATVIFVAALFSSSAATSGPQSYSGYGQYQQVQQQQQYHPSQQQDRWYTEASPASKIEQSSASTPESGTGPEETEQPPLPEGWSEHLDPNSGQYYYYNSADGTTSWDRPKPPETEDQGVNQSENNGDSGPSEQNPVSTGVADVARNPTLEQESLEPQEDKVPAVESSSTQPSGIQNSWGGQGLSQYSQDSWNSAQPSQQQPGGNWGQSNSTESSAVRGEVEVKKDAFDGQPQQKQPQPQQQVPSAGWGLPQQTKTDESPSKPQEPWGVRTSPEQQNPYQSGPPKQTEPPAPTKETQTPPSGISSNNAPSNGGWGMPKPTETPPSSNTEPSTNQGQSWQDQRPPIGNHQRPSALQGPPHASRPPPQQPGTPQPYPRQYPPPYGSYNPNAPPGQGQYDPRYGGPNSYGRGYPPQQPPGSGQLVSQTETGPSAVQEALSNTWKGLIGWGHKTREVVGTAKDQVVTGATAAGQSISAKSTSIWESAKSTVGGVFENNDSGSQSTYNLSGQPSPPGYHGRPSGPNQGYVPGGPGARGPPPRTFGGPQQQPGRFGPPGGQPPRYGAPPQSGSVQPPGRQQPPAPRPGYPNMQPRRDPPYPQRPNGQQHGPMQSQYGSQSNSQQPPPQGRYPPQQRPPHSGPPGGQPNGPGMTQGTPPQQEKPSDPWDHPALTGDY